MTEIKLDQIQITEMNASDWSEVARIYQEGIDTKIATFQNTIPTWEEWDKGHITSCRLVAKEKNQVIGWAALSPVSGRCVYAGVAEVSVYIAGEYRGKNVGVKLLEALITRSEAAGFWTLQSGILRENTASIKLHEKCGFRIVGYREKLGQMDNGKWHDVMLLERRSQK